MTRDDWSAVLMMLVVALAGTSLAAYIQIEKAKTNNLQVKINDND